MASIKGVSLKGIKKTYGREGEGFIANIYLNGKKVGEYADYADGAMGDYSFSDKEAEKTVVLAAFSYGKTQPNDFMLDLFNQRPQQYAGDVDRIKRCYPYVPEDDITMESVAYASSGLDIFISDIYELKDIEDYFKKMSKKGYTAVAVQASLFGCREIFAYPPNYTDEQIKADGCDKIFRSLEDFEIA